MPAAAVHENACSVPLVYGVVVLEAVPTTWPASLTSAAWLRWIASGICPRLTIPPDEVHENAW